MTTAGPGWDGIAAALRLAADDEGIVVAACSALKRSYRERLIRGFGAPIFFVVLSSEKEELARRLSNRQVHYMPPSLLASQLRVLEVPGADECAKILDGSQSPEQLCDSICALLDRKTA